MFYSAAPFFFFILLIQKKPILIGGLNLALSIAAGIFFSEDLYSWHISIRYIVPGLATIIANFQVFFMAVLGWFLFREALTLKIAAAVPAALFGLFLMVGINWNDLGPEYRMGVLWSLTAAVAYSGYMICLKKQQRSKGAVSAQSTLFMVCVATSVILGAIAVHHGESLVIPDVKNFFYMAGLGGFCHVGGWILITRGFSGTKSSMAGLLLLAQPTLSFIWDIVIFSRPTTMTDVLGAGISLAAIYMGTVGRRKKRTK